MAAIGFHGREDWCHICGEREGNGDLVDIWYPENAEHDRECVNYIRICKNCGIRISSASSGSGLIHFGRHQMVHRLKFDEGVDKPTE